MRVLHSIKEDYKAYYCEKMTDNCFILEISKDFHDNQLQSLTTDYKELISYISF